MKTIQLEKLPKCDLCNETAEYDDKTKMGPWGYLCKEHERTKGLGIGSKLEKRVKIAAKKTDNVPTVQLPLTLDSLVYAQCPHCGESRGVEPDANYTVTCESCDNKFRVVSAI